MENIEVAHQQDNWHESELAFILKKLTFINAYCHLQQKVFGLSFYASPPW